MPCKPKRPCNYPRCPNLSEQSYCELHRKTVRTESNRTYDQNCRDQEMRSFYISTEWSKLRGLKIKQSPICEECLLRGRINPAIIADHILPAREYPDLRLDIDNLQSLCRGCHNKKTAKERKNG